MTYGDTRCTIYIYSLVVLTTGNTVLIHVPVSPTCTMINIHVLGTNVCVYWTHNTALSYLMSKKKKKVEIEL